MGETSDSDSPRPISDLAKQWIDRAALGDGVSGTWRLEILQKRIRANADGTPKEGKEVPLRIRRFLKGIPWAHVHDAIRYLISQSPYEDVIYNGLKLDGKYRPTLTQWRRDDQEQVGGNAQGSYTLIQDLIEVTGGKDSASAPSSDSCSETVETEWVWDSPEIEELPYSSEQGVTYAIQQVRRNEDGTFDYAIVKRVARTQVSDETVVECDKYSTVSTVLYDNVYGGLGGEPYRDDLGNPLPIPAPCSEPAGRLVQIQRSQNPDCTFRIVVQRTESKERTQVTETEVTLRGTRTTTIVKNNGSTVPESGLGVGDRVRNELQPDGRYTTTKTNFSSRTPGTVSTTCQKTIFEHEHSETVSQSAKPAAEAATASGGVRRSREARRTEEGTWDVVDRTVTEIAVKSASVTTRKGLHGVVTTTVSRNVTSGSPGSVVNIGDEVIVEKTPGGRYNTTVTRASDVSVGETGQTCRYTVFEHSHSVFRNVTASKAPKGDVAAASGGVIHEVTSRATEFGTYDVTDAVTTELPVSDAEKTVRRTIRGTVTTVTSRNVADGTALAENVGDEVVVRKTPGGLYDRSETHAEDTLGTVLLVSCSDTAESHTDVETVVSQEAGTPHVVSVPNLDVSVESRATEGGAWDVTNRTVTYKELSSTGTVQHVGPYDSVASVTETVFSNAVELPAEEATTNRSVDLSVRTNGHGSMDGTVRMTEHRTVTNFRGSNIASADYPDDATVKLRQVTNVTSEETVRAGDGEFISSLSASVNGHGSIDASWQVLAAGVFSEWEAEIDTKYLYRKTVWFRHATKSDYERIFSREASSLSGKVQGWISGDVPPSSHSIVPAVDPERFKNRYSGSVTVSATWSMLSTGKDGGSGKIFSGWSDSSKIVNLPDGGSVSKMYNVYHSLGVGLKALEDEIKASSGDSGHYDDISFSVRDDYTWTFSRHQRGW